MSQENRYRVDDILQALKAGLGPYVLQRFEKRYGQRYLKQIEDYGRFYGLSDKETAIEKLDAQRCLKLILHQWVDVFQDRGKENDYAGRNYAGELLSPRNLWAHQHTLSDQDTLRIADTATRLLEAVGAEKEAEVTREIAEKYGHRIYSEREQKTTEEPAPATNADTIQESTPPQHRELLIHPSKRTSHADGTLQQLIRQNQRAIRFAIAIIIVIAFVLIVIASLTIDECDPEILGQRYSGLNHAKETLRCWGLPL